MPSAPTLPWLTSAPPPATRRVGAPRRRLSVRKVRLAAAAVCAFLATWLLAGLLAPDPPPHVVLTPVRDLPAGHALVAGDLTPVRVTDDLRPADAPSDVTAAVGRRLARPVLAREILTASALTVVTALAANERAVHVPIADPGAVATLHIGDRVDLVEGAAGRVVAASARILSVDDITTDRGGHGIVIAVPYDRISGLVPAMGAEGPGVTPVLRDARAAGAAR